ncbi:MAG: hypothetical protein Q4F00_01720 [bacterium]|nr:hypothetical protein [bacterium]
MNSATKRRRKRSLFSGLKVTADGAAYDAACKRLLAQRDILARLLKSCVNEFRNYDIKTIAEKCIEGSPIISEVPVNPDEAGAFIRGRGQERASPAEGSVFFDICFDAVVPDTHKTVQLIVNVEAQADYHPGYPLLKRSIYYCARLLSAQKETVFRKSHYEKLRKVYSIWVCTRVPKNRQNTITSYQISERNRVGKVCEKTANYDLISVVMICLGDEGGDNYQGILKLLGTLLTSKADIDEKKRILRDEFGIESDRNIDGEVMNMCNLSRGIEVRGIKKGRREGRSEGRREGRREGRSEGVLHSLRNLMANMHLNVDEAMNALGIPAEEQQQYIDALARA